MANNYEDIQNLTNGKNTMGLSNTIKRDYGIPLDHSSVQPNLDTAKEYAKGPIAYIGQTISVGDVLYIVSDESGGYLKPVGSVVTESDPTVPDWAKQPQKPTYTLEELGAQRAGDYALKDEIPKDYIKSVNGQIPDENGNVSISVDGPKPVGDEKSISVDSAGTIALKGFADENSGIPCIQKQKVQGQTVKSLAWMDPPPVLVNDPDDDNVKIALIEDGYNADTGVETVYVKVSDYFIAPTIDGGYKLVRSTPDGEEFDAGEPIVMPNSKIVVSETEPVVTEETIWLQPLTTDTGAVDYIVKQGIEDNAYYEKWNSGILKYNKAETKAVGAETNTEAVFTIPKDTCTRILTHNIQLQGSGEGPLAAWIKEITETDDNILVTYKINKPTELTSLTVYHSIVGFWK